MAISPDTVDTTATAELTPEVQEQRLAVQAQMPPTRIYLMRHGEPIEAELDRYYGQSDVQLSERGMRQSRHLAERLCDIPFDAVYSSDLSRAGYLADLIAEPRGLPVRRLEVLRERKMGELQGCNLEELKRDHPDYYANFMADRAHYRLPGAENFDDLSARVLPAIEELVAAFRGRRVAVATHAGPIRVTVAAALGMPLDNVLRIAVNHCGLFVIEYALNSPPRVTMMNG